MKFPSLKLSNTVNAHGGGGAIGGEAVRPFVAHNVKGKPRATQRVKKNLFMTILLEFRNQKVRLALQNRRSSGVVILIFSLLPSTRFIATPRDSTTEASSVKLGL